MKMARCNPELGPPSCARLRSSGDYLREVDLTAQSKRIGTSRFGPWWPGLKLKLRNKIRVYIAEGIEVPAR